MASLGTVAGAVIGLVLALVLLAAAPEAKFNGRLVLTIAGLWGVLGFCFTAKIIESAVHFLFGLFVVTFEVEKGSDSALPSWIKAAFWCGAVFGFAVLIYVKLA